jgi:uncharacterized protein YidB (DUF937 family)
MNQSGGLSVLLGSLHNGGLADTVGSWIGAGPNQAVSARSSGLCNSSTKKGS